jgi:hypothetical protein
MAVTAPITRRVLFVVIQGVSSGCTLLNGPLMSPFCLAFYRRRAGSGTEVISYEITTTTTTSETSSGRLKRGK